MLILLFVIFAVLTVLSIAHDWDEAGSVAVVITFCCLLGIFIFGYQVSQGSVIQDKIDMYTEENQKIESDIAMLVEKYMSYEGEVMNNASSESAITLVNLYPDLKSSELVAQEIQVHTDNNAKIKQLKEDKINLSVKKWWLYFGH